MNHPQIHDPGYSKEPEGNNLSLFIAIGGIIIVTIMVIFLYTLMFYDNAPDGLKELVAPIDQLRRKYFPSLEEMFEDRTGIKPNKITKLSQVGESDIQVRFKDGVTARITERYVFKVNEAATIKWDPESISDITHAELSRVLREEFHQYTAEETMDPKLRNEVFAKVHRLYMERLSELGIDIISVEMQHMDYDIHFMSLIEERLKRKMDVERAKAAMAKAEADKKLAIMKAKNMVELWEKIVILEYRVKMLEEKK